MAKFETALKKAAISIQNNAQELKNHFTDSSKMVEVSKTGFDSSWNYSRKSISSRRRKKSKTKIES
jgi:hypothetical protein